MAQSAWEVSEEPLADLEAVEPEEVWIKYLPAGTEVLATEPSGSASFWSRTARIRTHLANGDEKSYFFKLMDGEKGRLMAEGEFKSMEALYSVSPEMIPRPLGYGTLEKDPNNHFFICEYVNLADEVPDPSSICKALGDLRRKSIAMSPNGKYGFEVTTCNGTYPQDNRWNVSWEAFFAQQMEATFKAESEVHGPCPEYEALLPPLFDKVIPRLLRPLETGANLIQPALIHGDLWDGNVSFHAESDQPYIYDSSAFWGHNEYDMHNWRAARFKLGKSFIREYFKHFPMSAPQDDWDDRNLLYSLRADLHDSYLFPSSKKFRGFIIKTLEELVDKFHNGYEGPHKSKGQRHTPFVWPPPDGSADGNQAAVDEADNETSDASHNITERTNSEASPQRNDSVDPAPVSALDTAKPFGMASVSLADTTSSSEVRFGESAISPLGGSEAGGRV